MDINLPAIPAGVLTLLAFFAPYAQAVLQRPGWSTAAKRWLTVCLALALTAVAMVFYYAMTGDLLPSWPAFIILALMVASASYALVTKSTATKLEKRTSPDTGTTSSPFGRTN